MLFIPAAAAEDAEERVAERLSEIFVEVGVDERVQRRVKVTDPEEYLHHDIWTVARFPAQWDRQVPNHSSNLGYMVTLDALLNLQQIDSPTSDQNLYLN